MQLQTQLVITQYTLFEVYAFTALDKFHAFFHMTIAGLKKAQNSHIVLADIYRHALLKACATIVQVFLRVLDSNQLSELLYEVMVTNEMAESADQVTLVLSVIAADSNKLNLNKVVLSSAINTLSRQMSHLYDEQKNQRFGKPFFNDLMVPLMSNMNDEFVNSHHKTLFKFFTMAFQMPVVVESISECFTAFVLHLDEESMRVILARLCKWGMKNKKSEFYSGERSPIMCKVLTGVIEKLRDLVIGLIVPICFEPVFLPLLELLGDRLCTKKSKRGRDEPDTDDMFDLLCSLTRTIEVSFKYDTDSIFQPETHFEMIAEPMALLAEAHLTLSQS